ADVIERWPRHRLLLPVLPGLRKRTALRGPLPGHRTRPAHRCAVSRTDRQQLRAASEWVRQRPGAPVLQTIGDRMPAVEKGIDNTQTADKVPVELRILRMDEGCVADTNPVLKEEPFV